MIVNHHVHVVVMPGELRRRYAQAHGVEHHFVEHRHGRIRYGAEPHTDFDGEGQIPAVPPVRRISMRVGDRAAEDYNGQRQRTSA
jgi:hypothetical protein